jgi:outer membrane biosynthesis protein TonB
VKSPTRFAPCAFRPIFLFLLIFVMLVAGCGRAPTPAPGPSEADLAATVNAAVAATATAQVALEATVNAAVAATQAALPATPSAQPPLGTATLVVQPTDAPAAEQPAPAPTTAPPAEQPAPLPTVATTPPTPVVVDTSSMSEEELAAAIDAAVAEAVAASQAASAATTQATTDGAVSEDETVTVEVTLANAEEALAMAEALVAAYEDTYGQYAEEALDTLDDIESDLSAIADSTEEISAILEQGSEAATAAAAQMQTAAASASLQAAEVQVQAQAWQQQVHAQIETRAAGALATQPNQVAGDPQAALQSALAYVETVRGGLSDGTISQAELADIAQKGANASASLQTHGGPQLQSLAPSINTMTEQIARGQLPQARGSLDGLDASIPRRR